MSGEVLAAESVPNDGVGSTSLASDSAAPTERDHHRFGLASHHRLRCMLLQVRLARRSQKGITDRTARIQNELDDVRRCSGMPAEADAVPASGLRKGRRRRRAQPALSPKPMPRLQSLLADGRLNGSEPKWLTSKSSKPKLPQTDRCRCGSQRADDLRADIAHGIPAERHRVQCRQRHPRRAPPSRT